MHALVVERQCVTRALAHDLAERLARNLGHGKIVIVTDKPVALLSAVRKKWHRLERMVWLERAKTLDASVVIRCTNRLADMKNVSFSAKPPDDLLEADITFATIDDLIRVAPECRTMFVTYDFPKVKLHMVTSWMSRGGTVVIYD